MKQVLLQRFLLCALSITLLAVGAQAEQGTPYKIGWIGPLTGNAAVLGVESAQALKMVVRDINQKEGIQGKSIKVYIEDDQYQTAKTVRAYERLVHQEGVQVIFVLTYGGLFALADRAQVDDVILIDPLDCNEQVAKLPSNTFCVSQLTEQLGQRNAELVLQQKHSPSAIIYFGNDPFMGVVAKSTALRLKELNGEVVYQDAYEAGTTDFKQMLLRAAKRGANSLFLYGYDEIGTAMRQARSLGLSFHFYAVGTVTSQGLQDTAHGAAEGTLASVWQPPQSSSYSRFLSEFKEYTGQDRPNFEISTVPTYDVAQLLHMYFQGIRNENQEQINTSELRDFLYHIEEYAGASGNITMDLDGAVRTLPVKQWRLIDQQLVSVE